MFGLGLIIEAEKEIQILRLKVFITGFIIGVVIGLFLLEVL